MSRVVLVRHAQGSFGESNYDKLSKVGEIQARLLGEYWARRGATWDRVITGPRVRQKDTAAIVAEAYRKTGQSFPEIAAMPEFDEYHGEVVMQRSLPGLVERDPEVRTLHRALEESGSNGERVKNFQRLFEAVIGRWVEGKIAPEGVESWPEFCARVERGLAETAAGSGGRQVAIVTSGGPISVAVQRALELTPQNTLRVAWMVRNCATSEFLASGARFTLSSFNEVPHLDDASLLTYR